MTDARFELLGWPAGGPTLRLDHRAFAYAGKFVVSNTGTAVLRSRPGVGDPGGRGGDPDGRGDDGERTAAPEDGYDRDVLAAVSFDADRTDPDRLVLRYVTVRDDRRGEGLGPRLVTCLLERVAESGRFERARIAVNNPYAYEALYRAGFGYTGEQTGLAELVLGRPVDRPADADPAAYRAGLALFAERGLDAAERAFVADHRERGPPALLDAATGTDAGDDRGRHR